MAAKLTGWKVDIKSQSQYENTLANEDKKKEASKGTKDVYEKEMIDKNEHLEEEVKENDNVNKSILENKDESKL